MPAHAPCRLPGQKTAQVVNPGCLEALPGELPRIHATLGGERLRKRLVPHDGGTLGIALSFAVSAVFSFFVSSIQMAFSVWSLVSAFLCSSLIGVLFGYLPARNAARLDPIEVLARE